MVKTDEEEYAMAAKERKYLRARITKLYNRITSEIDSYGVSKRKAYYDSFLKLETDMMDINRTIRSLQSDKIGEEIESGMLDDELTYDDMILESLLLLEPPPNSGEAGLINQYIDAQPLNTEHSHNNNKIRLPPISLPSFSNEKSQFIRV